MTPAFATLVRALPSGWGLYAVEAAGRSDWLTAVGVLAGLAAAIALLLLAWSWKLGSPRAARATIRGARRVRIRRAGPLSGPVGGVAVKELRTWRRDPLRVQTIAVSLPWALGTCLLPLTFGSKVLLPWAGPAMALTAVTSSVNLYGQDGTALWLTLVIPGAERNDVRGRQRAFLFLFGPVVTVAAVALTALAGPAWTWPWVLALTPALLGGGIGLLAWMSVAALAPGPDPHRRPDNPMDNADATGPAYVMFWVGLLPCLPAVGAGAGRYAAAQCAVALGRDTGGCRHRRLARTRGSGTLVTGGWKRADLSCCSRCAQDAAAGRRVPRPRLEPEPRAGARLRCPGSRARSSDSAFRSARHLAVPSGNHPRCAEAGPRTGAHLVSPAVPAGATAMASLLRDDHPRRGRVLLCPVDNAATEEIQPGARAGKGGWDGHSSRR